MRSKRGATGLVGIVPVDKPAGMTSHDVVNVVRRCTGERRVGHAGTLDPLATGLLVVLVGPATRLAPWLAAAEKTYEARIVFGSQTDTDDADGTAIATADVPPVLADNAFARDAVRALEGERLQVPPAFSALKVDGRTAHRAARAGEDVVLEARPIQVADAELLAVDAGPPIVWDLRLAVSKGTYIRAVARDLGTSLGTYAHLAALRRTSSGTLSLDDAHTLDDVERAGALVDGLFVDPVRALGLPILNVDAGAAERVSHGCALAPEHLATQVPAAGSAVAVVSDGELLAVYRSDGERLYAAVVLPGTKS